MSVEFKSIKPYQTYMLDYTPSLECALFYYMQRNNVDNSEVDQHIKKIFLDIEVYTEFENKFPEPKSADKPINAITLINDKEDIDVLFLNHKDIEVEVNVNKIKQNIMKYAEDEYEFEINESKFNIHVFDSEDKLLIKLWELIHKYDPAILVGFNADHFDFPYIVNRTVNIFGVNDAKKLVTKFGEFEYGGRISIPEFQLVDILKMYKPGEGFGFGKNLDKFNLDTVAEEELGIKKVEHEDMSLDELYVKNPEKFIYYNLIDTYLIYRLDKRLKHFDLFNTQRRMTYCPVSQAYRGRSIMGEQLQTYYYITKDKKVPRSFLVKEKFAIETKSIDFNKSLSLSYYGAYVRTSIKGVFEGLIADLDQSLPADQLIIIKRDNNIFEIPIGKYEWREGDKTLTLDYDGNIVWKKVKGKVKHKCKYDVLEIETENEHIIKITANHSIFRIESGEVILVSADELCCGDKLIVYNRRYKEYDKIVVIIRDKAENYDYVYDISVEDTERFFARDPRSNGYILVHNTSMYPSLIKMFNMEYATYVAKIYNSKISVFFQYLQQLKSTNNKTLYDKLLSTLYDKIEYFIKFIKKPNNASAYNKTNRNIVKELLDRLINSSLDFDKIINNNDYYLFKTKLIPLLEIVELVSTDFEYNDIIYDYLMLPKDEFKDRYKDVKICVYEKPNDSDSVLRLVTVDELIEKYLKKYVVTITGALFYKHNEKLGHIIQTINILMKKRKEVKNRLKEIDPNTKEYELLYRLQLSIKVLLNSFYGIYGLTTYRYNEKNIANTITISGRFLIKTAQYVANHLINELLDDLEV